MTVLSQVTLGQAEPCVRLRAGLAQGRLCFPACSLDQQPGEDELLLLGQEHLHSSCLVEFHTH